MVLNATNLRSSSIRKVLLVAACLPCNVWIQDLTEVDLQINYCRTRYVFISLKHKNLELFGLGDGALVKIMILMYGICDAGDYWGINVHEHNVNDLLMLPAPRKHSLYTQK